MSAPDLQTRLDRLSLSQRGAARLLGLDERTIRRWIDGSRRVPAVVPMLLDLVGETSARTGETPTAILERLRPIEQASTG